jgi:probable HAF family extracellular repeat protein
MKNRSRRLGPCFARLNASALLTALLAAGTTTVQAQSYNVMDLGALPGNSTSTAQGLNDLGQAAGTSSGPSNGVATLFSGGKTISLGTFGASGGSFGEAVNTSGEVAGYDYSPSLGLSHAFLYSNGRMIDIHSASQFPSGTSATGINSSGEVVGYGWVSGADSHPFLYTGGKMVDLGTLGGLDGMASAINDSGQIVGHATTASGSTRGFLYSNGKMIDLGVPSGATNSTAVAISRNGEIAGMAWSNSGLNEPAFYSNGVWSTLGIVPGATWGTSTTGINASGQVVGSAIFPPIYGVRGIIHIGVIFVNGTPVDLDTLIPTNSGFTITGAAAINDVGEILCSAKTASKQHHAVLLVPR